MGRQPLNLPDEVWLPIEGHEEYLISNLGRFRKGNKFRKTSLNQDGYYLCYVDGKTHLLHRLVAKAFVPNPNNLNIVDHINEVKTDNRAENLRWVTIQQNTAYAHEARKARGEKKVYTRTNVLAIDQENNAFLYDNRTEAAHDTGVIPKMVDKVIEGYMKSCKGWKYITVETFEDRRTK